MKLRNAFQSFGVLTILLLGAIIAIAAPANDPTAGGDYSAKRIGYWKLQFSSKGNFEQKLSENERDLVLREIAPYYGWSEAESYSSARAILFSSNPQTTQEREELRCFVTLLNYGFDRVRYGISARDLNTICV